MGESTVEILLEELLHIRQELGDVKTEVSDIKRTVHNGLSSNVKELKEDFSKYKKEHVNYCPYVQEKENKKSKRNLKWQQIVGLVAFAGTLGSVITVWIGLI